MAIVSCLSLMFLSAMDIVLTGRKPSTWMKGDFTEVLGYGNRSSTEIPPMAYVQKSACHSKEANPSGIREPV